MEKMDTDMGMKGGRGGGLVLAPRLSVFLTTAETKWPFDSVCPEASFHRVQPSGRSRERSTNRCTLNDTIPFCDKGGLLFSWESSPNSGTRVHVEWHARGHSDRER